MFLSKILFFIIGSFCFEYSVQEPVTLVLYYEGLCPYSQEFIFDQLYPGYKKLGDEALSIVLVPYGHATYETLDNGTIEFTCQHGSEECLVNKIHACAINENSTQGDLISFVNCQLRKLSTEKPLVTAEECAKENGLSFDNINFCVSGPESDNLLIVNAERQNKLYPPLNYVPDIRFFDHYDIDLEDEARDDLVATVCALLEGTKPDICDNILKDTQQRLSKPKTSLDIIH